MTRASGPPQSGAAALADMSIFDVVAHIWRERGTALVVFLAVVVVGLLVVLQLPKTYRATTELLVRLDEAYVLSPIVGADGAGAALSSDEVIEAEVSFLLAAEVKRRVVDRLGVGAVTPDIARSTADDPPPRAARLAVQAMTQRMNAGAQPNAATIAASYRDADPDRAADVLAALVDEYLTYRRELLLGVDPIGLSAERAAAEARFASINDELEAFLRANAIGDFVSDRANAQARAGVVEEDLARTRADLAEARARLSAVRRGVGTLSPTVDLFVEDSAAQRLQELELQRAELLTRYLPDSRRVRELDAVITGLRTAVDQGSIDGGLTRRGVNPVRQDLEAQRLAADAQVAALAAKEDALVNLSAELRERLQTLQELAPEYQRLERRRAALENTVQAIASREEQARARRAITARTSENVVVIDPPAPPTRGESLRRPAFAAVVLLAGLLAAMAALARSLRAAAPRASAPRPAAANADAPEPVEAVVDIDDAPPAPPQRLRPEPVVAPQPAARTSHQVKGLPVLAEVTWSASPR